MHQPRRDEDGPLRATSMGNRGKLQSRDQMLACRSISMRNVSKNHVIRTGTYDNDG